MEKAHIVIVFVIIGFLIYKERQALGCPEIPNGSDCDNANGKAVIGTKPLSTDSTPIILDKIKLASGFAERWVIWRVAALIAIGSILLIYFLLYSRLPNGKEAILGVLVISSIIYFSAGFYNFHLIRYIKTNINDGVELLETRLT